MMWVYQKGYTKNGREEWQVGFFDLNFIKAGAMATGGAWTPIIDYPLDNEAGAQRMVHFLNGGD